MFFGLGGSSKAAASSTDAAASATASSASAKNARLLASVFRESIDNLVLESTRHRGMTTLRDLANTTRTHRYPPMELFHTLVLACDVSGHRKSCRAILFQCLADISKLFALGLMPVNAQAAQTVCDMLRRLAIVLPDRHPLPVLSRQQQPLSSASATSSRLPAALGAQHTPRQPTATDTSMESAGADSVRNSPSRQVQLGLMPLSPVPTSSADGGADALTASASTHSPRPPSRHEQSVTARLGREWALIADEELLLRLQQLLASLVSACPLGNAALPDLLGLLFVFYAGAAAGSVLEEVCGTTLAQRTHMYCGQLLHSSLEGESAYDGAGGSPSGVSGVTPAAAGVPPASGSTPASLPAQLHAASFLKDLCALISGAPTKWLRLTVATARPRAGSRGELGSKSSGPTTSAAVQSAASLAGLTSPRTVPGRGSADGASEQHLASPLQTHVDTLSLSTSRRDEDALSMPSSPLSGAAAASACGMSVAMEVVPHRLRVFVLRVLIALFTDQRPCDGDGDGGGLCQSDAAATAGTGSPTARPMNILFAQCLNEDILGLALAVVHPAFAQLCGSDDDDSDEFSVLSPVSTSAVSARAAVDSPVSPNPPSLPVQAPANAASRPTKLGVPTTTASTKARQQQQQERERQRTAAAATAAAEAEQRFVLVQKLVLLALSKNISALRNTASSLVLSHAMLIKQCRTADPASWVFRKVPGTLASPLSVIALLLALWMKAVASDALLQSLLSAYATQASAAPGDAAQSSTTSYSARAVGSTTNASDAGFPVDSHHEDKGMAAAQQLPPFVTLTTEAISLLRVVTTYVVDEGTDDAARESLVKDVREYLGDVLALLTMFGQSFTRLVGGACAHRSERPSAVVVADPSSHRSHAGQGTSSAALRALIEPAGERASGGGQEATTATATATIATSIVTATAAAPVECMALEEVTRIFLAVYRGLLHMTDIALQGLADEDALHITLKGVTHWIAIATSLGLPSQRNGFLRALLAALRQHDPTTDALLAYAIQHHPSAALSDREPVRPPAQERPAPRGAGRGSHVEAGAGAGEGGQRSPSTHRPHEGPSPSPPAQTPGTGAGGSTDAFASWVARNMRRFVPDAGAAAHRATSPAHSNRSNSAHHTSERRHGLWAGMGLGRLGKNAKSASGGAAAASGGAASSRGRATGAAGHAIFTTSADDQQHILVAVERLQQKFYVLRSLLTVASGMGESLGADGWAILAQGLTLVEPSLYRLQLFILWIAEAAVEREQQQQLLSDAYHLRDAVRSLFVESVERFSNSAYATFLSAMLTAAQERSALVESRLAERLAYVQTLEQHRDGSGLWARDVSPPPDTERDGTLDDRHSHGSSSRPTGAVAVAFGLFFQWRLLSESLCLAYLSALPLNPARAALTWRAAEELHQFALDRHRLRQWCCFLKTFPLRVSMLTLCDGLHSRVMSAAKRGSGGGGATAGSGGGDTAAQPLAGTASTAGSAASAAVTTAAANASNNSGGGGGGSGGGAAAALAQPEMHELSLVVHRMIENVATVCGLTSLLMGRAHSLLYDAQLQQTERPSAPSAADVPLIVESMVGYIVSALPIMSPKTPAGAAAAAPVGPFSTSRLAQTAAQVLCTPTLANSLAGARPSSPCMNSSVAPTDGESLLSRLVAQLTAPPVQAPITGPAAAVAPLSVLQLAGALVSVVAASAPLPFASLDCLYAKFQRVAVIASETSTLADAGKPLGADGAESERGRQHLATAATEEEEQQQQQPVLRPLTMVEEHGAEALLQLCHDAALAVLREAQRIVQAAGETIRGDAWRHLLRLLQRTVTREMAEQPSPSAPPALRADGDTENSNDSEAEDEVGAAAGESGDPAAAVPLATESTVQLAFRTLEMVQHNCITNLDAGGLDQLMRSAGAFVGFASDASQEEKRLHTNLSAVQIMWSIADYLAQDLPSLSMALLPPKDVPLTAVCSSADPLTQTLFRHADTTAPLNGGGSSSGSGSGGDRGQWSQDTLLALPPSDRRAFAAADPLARVAMLRNALWSILLLQLQENGCEDARQEVRQSSQKTLFSLVQTHGSQYSWACWQSFLMHILEPQMEVVLLSQQARNRAVGGDSWVAAHPLLSADGLGDERPGLAAPSHRPSTFYTQQQQRGSPAVVLSSRAHALRRILASPSPVAFAMMEEMRVTITDGAGRVLAAHYAAITQRAIANAHRTAAQEMAIVQAVLSRFVNFCGSACVVCPGDGQRFVCKEETALSAIHAVHSLLIELPEKLVEPSGAGVVPCLPSSLQSAAWAALERALFFNSALSPASAGGAGALPVSAAAKTQRTPAVVSALVAALCDDFCLKRSVGLRDRPQSPVHGEGYAAETADRPGLGRLLRVMAFVASCDAVVTSYFFPSRVQNTLVEAVNAMWPLLESTPAAAAAAPVNSPERGRHRCSGERGRLLHEYVYQQFPALDRVRGFVRESNSRAIAKKSRSLPAGPSPDSTAVATLREALPPGAHPSALLQLLHLVCTLALQLPAAAMDAGAVESTVGPTLAAPVDGQQVRLSDADRTAVAVQMVETMGRLLLLQYAAGEALTAGPPVYGVVFSVPKGFFGSVLSMLEAVLWRVLIVPSCDGDGDVAATRQVAREQRQAGATALAGVLSELVSVAALTVKAYERPVETHTSPAPAAEAAATAASQEAASKGSVSQTFSPQLLPESLHGALTTLDRLVSLGEAVVQKLITAFQDTDSASLIIAALVAVASSTETAAMTSVSQRSLAILQQWSSDSAPSLAAPGEEVGKCDGGASGDECAGTAATSVPEAAGRPHSLNGSVDAERDAGGMDALHALVKASLHTRCRTIIQQYLDCPLNLNVVSVLQEALVSLRRSCPPPPPHSVPASGAAAVVDLHAAERESLRLLLPDLVQLVACPGVLASIHATGNAPPSPLGQPDRGRVASQSEVTQAAAEMEMALRRTLADTLTAVHSSLGMLLLR